MASQRDRRQDASLSISNPIPVFPLPNVVFFPRTYLPLHIFEPRYCEMVADAVAEGHCVGMALLKEGWEQNYYGNPPIHGIGCVGRLVSLQQLPDGRYNILLYGLDRYEICEQFYEKSYRQATVRLKPLPSEPLQDRSLRTHLVQLLHRYMQIFESSSLSWAFLESNVDDQVFLNHVAACLEFTPVEKQFLLEADTVTQQARRLSDLLQFKIHERDGIKGQG